MSLNNGHAFQCNYIPDGYSLKGFIAELPGLFGSLNFLFRPPLPKSRAIIIDKIRKASPEKAEEESAKVIAAHVSEWDLTHPTTGDKIDLKVEEILRMQPSLMARLFSIVIGSSPTDINPEWTAKDRQVVSDDLFEQALTGTLEQDQAKN